MRDAFKSLGILTVYPKNITELEISFEECDYSSKEGSGLMRPIRIRFYGPTQNSFTLSLSAMSIDTADGLGLGIFIDSTTHKHSSRATAGKIILSIP